MTEFFLAFILLLLLAALGLLWALVKRTAPVDLASLRNDLATLEKLGEKTERTVRDELAVNRQEIAKSSKDQREEMSAAVKAFGDSVLRRLTDVAMLQKSQLETFSTQLAALTQSNEQRMEQMRQTLQQQLTTLGQENSRKLEEMRLTVDEKLHRTLEARLGESFKQVSDRLEQVHKGLGEMQSLAVGVGDLKRVLSNVKVRGTWGEIQLGNLLEQMLAPEQYARNQVTRKGSSEPVEFAIRFPGSGDGPLWLPIDAKFPQEDYQRLLEAQDRSDAAGMEEAARQLEQRIRSMAKTIHDKYVDPPNTTDFAILYLPIEGLYAEVLRRPGLAEALQRDYRVNVSGPTTLAALLNSLQLGFRTLAITQRADEVWTLLGAVKTQFGKFGEMLERLQKQLATASRTVEDAAGKSRTIVSKLRKVEELPADQAAQLLPMLDEDEPAEPPELPLPPVPRHSPQPEA